jgi:hypothetical protein
MRQIGAADDAAERAVMQTFDIGLHQDLQHRFRDSLQEISVAALLQQRCFRSSKEKQALKQTLRCRWVQTCPVCVPAAYRTFLARVPRPPQWGAGFAVKLQPWHSDEWCTVVLASRAAPGQPVPAIRSLSKSYWGSAVQLVHLRHFSLRTATFDIVSDRFAALSSPWYGK